jgi:surface antigen
MPLAEMDPARETKVRTFVRETIDNLLTNSMTADDICGLLAGKTPEATRKQNNLQAAILAALRKRDGGAVVGEGSPAKWQLKEAAQAALDEKQYGDKCHTVAAVQISQSTRKNLYQSINQLTARACEMAISLGAGV